MEVNGRVKRAVAANVDAFTRNQVEVVEHLQ
jgi:hypothetical protein